MDNFDAERTPRPQRAGRQMNQVITPKISVAPLSQNRDEQIVQQYNAGVAAARRAGINVKEWTAPESIQQASSRLRAQKVEPISHITAVEAGEQHIDEVVYVSSRELRRQDIRKESIPPGLHVFATTTGNEKARLGQDYIRWGNQDRITIVTDPDQTILAVVDEGQGADTVDILSFLLLTAPHFRQNLYNKRTEMDRDRLIREQLNTYAEYDCNTGFAISFFRPVTGGYLMDIYSAGNVYAFLLPAMNRKSILINSPKPAGEPRTNLYQNFNAFGQEVEHQRYTIKSGDMVILASDGMMTRQVDGNSQMTLPPCPARTPSLQSYCEAASSQASRVNFGNGMGQGYDDRTILAAAVR